MKLCGFIVALQILRVYSASIISAQGDNELLLTAAVNIVDECFGSSERWSELLIIAEHARDKIVEEIYHKSKTSNLVLTLGTVGNDKFRHSAKDYGYLNTSVKWQKTKTTAVVTSIHSPKLLDSIFSFLKNYFQGIWRSESYFLIVLETRCNAAEYNNVFKVTWNYWVLNAVILCMSNDRTNRDQSGIELYTFNPYSGDHSQQWETIINETVEVSIYTGKFNHSWYVFKQRFTGVGSFDDCGDIFFDKTLNLDGYVIPISVHLDGFLSDSKKSDTAKWAAADSRILKTVAKKLRFKVVQVVNNATDSYGRLFGNGTYSGMMADIHNGRSHLVPVMRSIELFPGLETTYPHNKMGICFASRIVGNRPQWTNLADAKHIWISLGLGLLFVTVVLYLQNKSHGIVSAFLDAERLIVGSSIIRTSTAVKHRIILGSIFLVLLVVDGAIRGRFISILTVARPYPNFDTLTQLTEQDVDMYGHDLLKAVIIDSLANARFSSKISPGECIDSLHRGEPRRACFTDCMLLTYLTLNSSIIHRALTPVLSTDVAFFTAMHWPMKNRYSFEVQKLLESGIFKKWQLEIYREVEVNAWKLKRAAEPPYVRSIKPNDLLPAFVLLFVGLSVALIIFAWEMKDSEKFRPVKF